MLKSGDADCGYCGLKTIAIVDLYAFLDYMPQTVDEAHYLTCR